MMEAKIDIEKVRKGDHAAFKTFFECFYPKLMALACRFVDEQVAKDLVQEVFTSYWEQKKVIQPDNIQSFLFKWLQNSCLNHIKHQMIVDEYESCVLRYLSKAASSYRYSSFPLDGNIHYSR